jgi:hypothetical protein
VAAFLEKRPARFRMSVSGEMPDVFPGFIPRHYE